MSAQLVPEIEYGAPAMPHPLQATPPDSTPVRLPARLPALDALRGIAILLVLLYHFAPQGRVAAAAAATVLPVMRIGWVGVDLFLVLSGFLITGILLDARGEKATLRRFYGRRALRILPLYYLTLAVLVGAALLLRARGTPSPSGELLVHDQAWYWLHGANLAAARDPRWVSLSWVQHFWSLAVEEQFYLVWPLIVMITPRRNLGNVCGVVVAAAFLARISLALVGERAVAAYVLTPARADALAMGALLAIAWRTPEWHARATRIAAITLPLMALGLASILVGYGPNAHSLLMATIGHSYFALLFAALLWLAIAPPVARDAGRGWMERWQAWLVDQRWLHWLARYSYGLYVVHYPLRALLEHYSLTGADLTRSLGFWTGGVLGLGIGVLASLAVAVPLWHVLEQPILTRGGAWLDRRLRYSARRKPSVRWLPSHQGALAELPQRHSATRSSSTTAVPSSSSTRTGPLT